MAVGCWRRQRQPDGHGGMTGSGGTGDALVVDPADLISDFEDLAAATVVMAGTPARNGYWYTYNDDNPDGNGLDLHPGTASPGHSGQCYDQARPTLARPRRPPRRRRMGQASAHRRDVPSRHVDGLQHLGRGHRRRSRSAGAGRRWHVHRAPKVPYDIGAFKGVTFLAMATAGTDTALRIKFPMTDETKVEDGGLCVESATTKCSDDFGSLFNLPQQRHLEADHDQVRGHGDVQAGGLGRGVPLDPGARDVDPDPVRRTRTRRTTSSSTTSTSSSSGPIDPFARRVPSKRARRRAFSAGFAYKGC